MSKKFKAGFLLLIVVVIAFLSYKIVEKARIKQRAQENMQLLPEFKFRNLDGNMFGKNMLKKNMPVVFILFNTECGYCQYEAEEIQKNSDRLKGIQVLLISEEPADTIRSFINNFDFGDSDEIKVLMDHNEAFLNTFGTNAVPVVLIYDKSHRLVKQYNGETKIEAIIKAARNQA